MGVAVEKQETMSIEPLIPKNKPLDEKPFTSVVLFLMIKKISNLVYNLHGGIIR